MGPLPLPVCRTARSAGSSPHPPWRRGCARLARGNRWGRRRMSTRWHRETIARCARCGCRHCAWKRQNRYTLTYADPSTHPRNMHTDTLQSTDACTIAAPTPHTSHPSTTHLRGILPGKLSSLPPGRKQLRPRTVISCSLTSACTFRRLGLSPATSALSYVDTVAVTAFVCELIAPRVGTRNVRLKSLKRAYRDCE